ncbi:tetratricopeptide repeat protein [candidate division WOR-3 bacterium]|nr:tetratricopeptide repeat protein [candidate division WOR-3 bacterium]TET77225.1 MAG: tetratricopeptide repeat protein [Candidatus Cloacimonadota bacterium]
MINNYKFPLIVLATVLFISSSVSGFTIRRKNNNANKLFYKEEYKNALDLYDELDIKLEKEGEFINTTVKYNRANTVLKLNNFEEAIDYYNKARSTAKDKTRISHIYYNMGNTLYRAGKLEEAINYYIKTLDIDPNDKDAKFNIELIKKKLEKHKKEEKEKKENDKEKKEKDKGKKDKKEEERDKKQQKEEKKEEREKPQKEKKKQGISKEDALRILKALEQREKELRKNEKAKMKGRVGLSKDW